MTPGATKGGAMLQRCPEPVVRQLLKLRGKLARFRRTSLLLADALDRCTCDGEENGSQNE